MKKDKIKCGKTLSCKRLTLLALTAEQMKLMCDDPEALFCSLNVTGGEKADAHLSAAYGEMYRAVSENHENFLWNTLWLIILKSEKTVVGSIGFLGSPNANHEAEIGYGIDGKYRKNGYAAEALAAMADWAFSNGVYFLRAETPSDNEPSVKLLTKSGFSCIGKGAEGDLYELEKPASTYMVIYMCLGMSVGMLLGNAFGDMTVGMSCGMLLGVALGSAMDASDKAKRKRPSDSDGKEE